MNDTVRNFFQNELNAIEEAGLLKPEYVIEGSQKAQISVDKCKLVNMCANNYLGLASHPEVIAAAKVALDKNGFGTASVRFICGTMDVHKELEEKLTTFLGTEKTILYSSCFDANGGLFETLCGENDAIISDELNHASIIDGIRLSKAARFRFKHADMDDLELKLKESASYRIRLIATDGVFSMDGAIANLEAICNLAEKYNALVMVDDSHATGFFGATGRGSHEHCGVMGRVDLITGTLGKALGGAGGGFISGRREIIAILRQRSRPYLFSNALSPCIVAASCKAIELAQTMPHLRKTLMQNTDMFRSGLKSAGFNIKPGKHPIVPIMLYDADLTQRMARLIFKKGVYAIGFFFPVVPKHQARIRCQVSATHSREDLQFVLEKLSDAKMELKINSIDE